MGVQDLFGPEELQTPVSGAYQIAALAALGGEAATAEQLLCAGLFLANPDLVSLAPRPEFLLGTRDLLLSIRQLLRSAEALQEVPGLHGLHPNRQPPTEQPPTGSGPSDASGPDGLPDPPLAGARRGLSAPGLPPEEVEEEHTPAEPAADLPPTPPTDLPDAVA